MQKDIIQYRFIFLGIWRIFCQTSLIVQKKNETLFYSLLSDPWELWQN